MDKIIGFVLIMMLASSSVKGQAGDYSADVKSPDAIIAALYDVISGSAGSQRNWERFRFLFNPESRLLPTRKSDSGDLTIKALTIDEYIQLFSTRIVAGFYEKEIHRKMESYGTVIHAFSTYETRDKANGPVTNRGINSIQLFKDQNRYYIINIFWCPESMGFPLPEKYLK